MRREWLLVGLFLVLFLPPAQAGVVYINDDFSFGLIGEYKLYHFSPMNSTVVAQLNVTSHGLVKFLLFKGILFNFNDTIVDNALYIFAVDEYIGSETHVLDLYRGYNYTIVLWKNAGDDIHSTDGHLLVSEYSGDVNNPTMTTTTSPSDTTYSSTTTNYTLPFIPIVTNLPVRNNGFVVGPEVGVYIGAALVVVGLVLAKYEG